jgi:hypothetical protein
VSEFLGERAACAFDVALQQLLLSDFNHDANQIITSLWRALRSFSCAPGGVYANCAINTAARDDDF